MHFNPARVLLNAFAILFKILTVHYAKELTLKIASVHGKFSANFQPEIL